MLECKTDPGKLSGEFLIIVEIATLTSAVNQPWLTRNTTSIIRKRLIGMSLSFRFGTVGSPISTPKKPGGSVGATIHTRELGMGALELGWVRSVRVSEKTCAAIRQAGEEHDVLLSVHAPYYINLNANEDEWPKPRQRLMDAAHYGNLAGATEIIFHPGSYFEQPPEDVLKVAIPRLAGCVEELRAAGNPVTLRPETMGKSARCYVEQYFDRADQIEKFAALLQDLVD